MPVPRSNSLPTRAVPPRSRSPSSSFSGGTRAAKGKKPAKKRVVPEIAGRVENLRSADPSPTSTIPDPPLPPRRPESVSVRESTVPVAGEGRCLFYVAFQPEPNTLCPPQPLRLQLNSNLPMSRVFDRIRRHLGNGFQFALFWDGAPVNDAMSPTELMMPSAGHSGEFCVLQVVRTAGSGDGPAQTDADTRRMDRCEERAREAELRLLALEEEITKAARREAQLAAELATRDAEIRELRESGRRVEREAEHLQNQVLSLQQEQELEDERSGRAAEAERVRWREQVDMLNLDLGSERQRALDMEGEHHTVQEEAKQLKLELEAERVRSQELVTQKEQTQEIRATPEAASMRAALKSLIGKYQSLPRHPVTFDTAPRGHADAESADYSPARWEGDSSPGAASSEGVTVPEIEAL
eukprot:Hpha_TRINITY_DN15240_c1_g2::TRINITY_DN15240_c1_g2_i3::g.66125::m.66125